ncbi:hypothetical protein [Actinoplanes sp. NPDC026623]|uniref:hypothetical protein n=1 Tax=Actinoplanes sp. NPDC026623 TaxID=3155610 RepID=UPI0033E7AC5A
MTLKTRLTGTLAALGDALAERFGSRRHTAALDLAETIARVDAGDGFAYGALFCDEAEALARYLTAFGFHRIGVDVLLRHSDGYHSDGNHGEIVDWVTAEAYLNRLIGDRKAQTREAADKLAALDGDGDLDGAQIRPPQEFDVRPDGEPLVENDCR